MVKLLNSAYLGASTPDDYGQASGVVELLPFELYLGAAVPSGGKAYIDVILSGVSPLVLTNAIENGLNYLKLFGGTEQLPETYLDTVTLSGGCEQNGTPSPNAPIDIVCNNGVVKVNRNLYSTEYHDQVLSQINGVTITESAGVNVSGMVDCRTIKSFKITTVSPQGSFRIFKYRADNTFINASSTASIGDIITLEDNVGFFRIQYNYTSTSVDTEDILIYNSAYNLNEIYTDGTQEVVTDSVGNTASAEMLLAVSTYKDTQEIISGSVTRNIGIKVLDGTEDWVGGSGSYSGNCYCDDILPNVKAPSYSSDDSYAICTAFDMVKTLAELSLYKGWISNHPAGRLNLWYGDTVENFKVYLAQQYANGTPVIIVYPTSSATTESVSGQFLSKSPVTQTAGSISNLPIAITESSHTVPTPQQPLQINCNNGVVKYQNYDLPSGYTKLEYIASNGSQHIDTGITNVQTGSQVEVTFKSDSYNSWQSLYGNSFYTNSWFAYCLNLSTQKTSYIYGTYYDVAGTIDTDKHTIKQDSNKFYLDGELVYTATTATFTNNSHFLLFARANASNVAEYKFRGRIYNAKIYNNDTLVFDGIPAKRTSDSVVGMYDTVSGTFFTNAGTGTFTAGAEQPAYIYTDGTVETVEIDTTGGTATAENLFKVGTYKDEQSVIDGGVTRNVGIKVLDGTESWQLASGTPTRFYLSLPNGSYNNDEAFTPYCTHCQGCLSASGSQSAVGGVTDGVGFWYDTTFYKYYELYLRFGSITSITNATTLKAYLADQYNAGFPVIVVYPLATPTTETVTGQPLTVQTGTNIVEITQASMDDLTMEVSYKAGVSVTITEVENAQLDNSVEVTING